MLSRFLYFELTPHRGPVLFLDKVQDGELSGVKAFDSVDILE